jgi:uncharacterized protein
MTDMAYLLVFLAIVVCCVGHACIWTAILNNLYGRPLPKTLLKWWRHMTALILLAFPLLLWTEWNPDRFDYFGGDNTRNALWGGFFFAYAAICFLFGIWIFPSITIKRRLRKTPTSVIAEQTRTLDLWSEMGSKLIGDNKLAAMARLPGNGVFRVDITDLTLALAEMPVEWDGLTLLVLSDLHFHGTPSRAFFDRIVEELLVGSPPDLVCLIGDYIDSDSHHEWLEPILGRLHATEGKLAILGNHDRLYNPERVRRELAAAGYAVLGNGWREIVVRGVKCVAIGHEGPWFAPGPDVSAAPSGPFRLCLSHTPDNFYWAQANKVGLMLCGHVHGGGIRVPLIGPIFVPSVYGRRFDSGVFEENGTFMVVSRGLSGKEPLRYRCNPQVIRITLRVGLNSKRIA